MLELIGWNDYRNIAPLPSQPPPLSRMTGKWGGSGEYPNGITESYHFLTGEDLYDTAKANGLE